MRGFNNKIQKSLLYNLIIFDFIFLTNYTKKTSNLATKKYHVSKNLYVVRLAVLELLKSIKRFLRSFQFLNKWKDKKTLLYICIDNPQYIQFLNVLFEKYNLNTTLNISTLLPGLSLKSNELKSILILDKLISNSSYKNLNFYQFFLVQEVNSFNNINNSGAYKIYNNLNDFKKLLFLGIFLLQILKK
jgi:hypothetical protein|tara:strand:- start:12480 stop:13043 length:564 start_codon:yes stop_codon:yes gene_type:complete